MGCVGCFCVYLQDRPRGSRWPWLLNVVRCHRGTPNPALFGCFMQSVARSFSPQRSDGILKETVALISFGRQSRISDREHFVLRARLRRSRIITVPPQLSCSVPAAEVDGGTNRRIAPNPYRGAMARIRVKCGIRFYYSCPGRLCLGGKEDGAGNAPT